MFFITIVSVVRSAAHVKCAGKMINIYSRITLYQHSFEQVSARLSNILGYQTH
jgi:hypothetical protein